MESNGIQRLQMLCCALFMASLIPAAFPGQPNLVDVTTYHNDNARLGLNANETTLTLLKRMAYEPEKTEENPQERLRAIAARTTSR